ncbi:MAG: cobalamin B12-binding domain-containing protein, partial [Pseudobutyrivibrio sp.]|nr:cobalamin B12-binding domain-containing protein [Pseudobutyrivibrio sp.]
MEAALRIYPGRALINSISCEEGKMKEMLAIAQKYGAMFILLPLSGAGLPKNLEEKKQHIDTILEYAVASGLSRDDAIVDVLVQTVGADPTAALECFETIDYCKNVLRLPTTCGLSNISFGLPQRAFINAAYLNIAVSRGLTMAIANPSQELLMFTALASDVLMNKEGATEKYIANVHELTVSSSSATSGNTKSDNKEKAEFVDPVTDCVIKGNKARITECIKEAVNNGAKPKDIVENSLIPGINKVGDLYDKKKYFLPQLIAGANAMEAGMKYLEPMLVSDSKEKKATIVFATVEGDIHDIGKNLVVLMLRNYGYDVIDLGKDVPAEKIVKKAIENNAKIIGLSALMTTTMMKMKEVVDLKNEMGCKAKVIIGGACINESFKDEIGADGYSTDAADCVKLVQSIV